MSPSPEPPDAPRFLAGWGLCLAGGVALILSGFTGGSPLNAAGVALAALGFAVIAIAYRPRSRPARAGAEAPGWLEEDEGADLESVDLSDGPEPIPTASPVDLVEEPIPVVEPPGRAIPFGVSATPHPTLPSGPAELAGGLAIALEPPEEPVPAGLREVASEPPAAEPVDSELDRTPLEPPGVAPEAPSEPPEWVEEPPERSDPSLGTDLPAWAEGAPADAGKSSPLVLESIASLPFAAAAGRSGGHRAGEPSWAESWSDVRAASVAELAEEVERLRLEFDELAAPLLVPGLSVVRPAIVVSGRGLVTRVPEPPPGPLVGAVPGRCGACGGSALAGPTGENRCWGCGRVLCLDCFWRSAPEAPLHRCPACAAAGEPARIPITVSGGQRVGARSARPDELE